MARSAAEAYVTGLAPYLSALLQNRQLGQQQAYHQQQLGLQGQEIGLRGQQLGLQQQQIGQTGAYQQGMLANAEQQRKAQAVQMLNQAAQADPLNMTGVMDKALSYYRSVMGGESPQQPGPQAPGTEGMGVMASTSGLSQALRAGVTGPELLQRMPNALRNQIEQILEGRAAPPSLSSRNPQSRQLMMLASAVDPSFDATQYGQRFQTTKAFSSGPQSNAIRSVNQTMNHAMHLLQNINELGNVGGYFPGAKNYIGNLVGEHVLGQSIQQNFEQTVGALSSELRKVFAAAGGGSLTELKDWEKNFPLNASSAQQRSYLKNGMDLLGGAINALQDQYRRGFGPSANVESLLSPSARKALEYIRNMDPETGQPMGAQPQQGAPQGGQVLRAQNPQTGQVIISNDGGQTWQPAQ